MAQQIDFGSTSGPSLVSGITEGINSGMTMGFRAQQMKMAQEQAAQQAQEIEMQKRKAQFDELAKMGELRDKLPKRLRFAYDKQFLAKSNELFPDQAVELDDLQEDDTDDVNDYVELLNKRLRGELDDNGFKTGTALIMSQVSDRDAKRIGEIQRMTETGKHDESGQFVGMQGGQAVIFNPKSKTMETVALPGGGPLAPKNMTDTQAQSAVFAARGSDANQQLEDLIQGGFDPAALEQGVQKLMPNYLQGENAQALDQIGRNFVAAVLRKESGAAITDSEWADGKKQYIPQTGDKPKVLMLKAINRQRAIQGFALQAGNASLPAIPGAKASEDPLGIR